MDCSQFEEKLSDFLDGALAQNEVTRFREHAMQCRPCRALMDEVKSALGECHQDEAEVIDMPMMLESSLLTIAEEHREFDCFAFEEIVTEFLDGFVPAATYHRFEEHAADCSPCSNLLTDVVFAVAACHSVHTYEEVELPASLFDQLTAISNDRILTFKASLGSKISAWAARGLPRAATRRWSLATAASIAFATFMLLLFGFSEDRTVAGIYRHAQYKFAQLYSSSANLYAQKDTLAGRLERVGMGIDEIWDGLGGEKSANNIPDQQKEADKPQPPQKD